MQAARSTRLIVVAAVMLAFNTHAQHDPSTPAAVAAKVALRGDARQVVVREMRVVRRNEILTVQADLSNADYSDRSVFYRFRWLDGNGGQIGDGESWKQIPLMGHALQTIKSVAPTSAATDFRLEMNVEYK